MFGWLKTIVNRAVVDFARRIPTNKEGNPGQTSTDAPDFEEPLGNAAPSAREVAEKHEKVQLIRDALSRLPPEYAQVIRMHGEKCSWAEIGRAIGRSADAARMLHRRAVREFAEQLKGLR